MNTVDAVASVVIVVALAVLLMYAWERLFPSDKSAADLGYIPNSEAPEGGWGRVIIGAVLAIALSGFVMWAGVIVGL